MSVRRAELDLNVPRHYFHNIARNRLHIFPYKLHIVQQIENHDLQARMRFGNCCLQDIKNDEFLLNAISYSDEFVVYMEKSSSSITWQFG